MRRLGVLLVLFGVMFGVTVLKSESGGLANSMTLAAIGFVLLASFTLAEAGSLLSLPRVTGYILAGAMLGPSVADVLSRRVVDEMQMFNTLALGLIATAAGLELDVRQIARIWRTLVATIAVKVLLGIAVVGGAVYAWEGAFHTLGLPSRAFVLAFALVFGTLSIGTSPAIALAVTSELRSKGRLSDLVLGAAVLKDLVVVVMLAVSVALAQGLTGNGTAKGARVIAELTRELGLSIGVGLALGGLLVLYLRYVRAEMLLFVAAMILVIAELSHALHLELLLVFIAAGFVVRNLSRFEHELMQPVQLVALPVFVVFFTNAGANLDLLKIKQVLPLAITMAAARAAVYYVAGRVGGGIGAESPFIRRNAWLSYLPQAGVTLGLVGLAATKLTALREPILVLGAAFVAVNLLVGPITLRLALRRSGEVARRDSDDLASATASDALSDPSDSPSMGLGSVLARTTEPRVLALARRLSDELTNVSSELQQGFVAPWVATQQREIAQLLANQRDTLYAELAVWSANAPSVLATQRCERVQDSFRRVRHQLRQLPELESLPVLERHGTADSGDGRGLRLRKQLLRARLKFSRKPARFVPVVACARVALESRIARAYTAVVAACNANEARVLVDLQAVTRGELRPEEASVQLTQQFHDLLEMTAHQLERALALGVAEFIRLLEDAGSPGLPLASIRYSDTEAEVRRLMAALDQQTTSWARALAAARNSVQLGAIVAAARHTVNGTLQKSVLDPLIQSFASSAGLLGAVERTFETVKEELTNEQGTDAKKLSASLREVFSEPLWIRVEGIAAHFRSQVSTHRVALEVRRAMDGVPRSVSTADVRSLAAEGVPTYASPIEIPAASIWQEILLKGLMPGLEEEVRRTAVVVMNTPQRLHEAEEIAVYALEQLEINTSVGARSLAWEALGRAEQRLLEQSTAINEMQSSIAAEIQQRVDAAFQSLSAALLEPGTDRHRETRRAILQRFTGGLRQARVTLAQWWEDFSATLQRIGRSDVSRTLLSRYRKVEMDADGLREWTAKFTDPLALPASYLNLYSPEPLVGPRLFVAYRKQLVSLVDAERAWLEGGVSSALVLGAHGTGRTSLLNQCKLELSAPRVVRLEPQQWGRPKGLLASLAASLGTATNEEAIIWTLSSTHTTIIVDDLEQWITPDVEGASELEEILDLIVRTAPSSFWIVSLEASVYELYQELMPVAHAFGRVVRLDPLTVEELRRVIEERHRISGRSLRHASGPLSAIRDRIPGFADHDVSWRVLTGLSDGILSRALLLWVHAVMVEADGDVDIAVPRLLRAAVPFIGWLHPRDQAILAQLSRFGPLHPSRLSNLLGLGQVEVARRLAFLRAGGVIEGGHVEQDPARIIETLKPTVLQGIRLFQVKS